MGKYFSVTKKIPIAASKQHAAFASGDVLSDWVSIQIPKGTVCLKSVTILVRPKGDASPTWNNFPGDIVFSKTNTVSLGTVNSNLDHRPNPDFIGAIEIDAANYASGAMQSTSVATLGNDIGGGTPPLILTGDPTTGDNVGYDTLYVGIIARDAWDFTSINTVNETGFSAGAQTVITMDDGSAGGTMDVREHFAAGDILHAQDDAVLGTLASADSATQLTLTAANTDAIAENDVIYNLHPITLILGFEK